MKLYKLPLLIHVLLLFVGKTYAQTIQGEVTDSLNKPIPFASITLKNSDNVIVIYTTGNENGAFSLTIPSDIMGGNLSLEAGSLGYKKQVKSLTEVNNFYSFILSPEYQQLEPVVIKDSRPKIKVRGDTISYKVEDFSNRQDRVIGDVLKKMPGIEVSASGKISYNGKPISGFYIDGDNLLDDKYNIATTTVPNAIVESVQIMENHQPIKVLRNKFQIDNVGLNITFKKDAKLKLVGQAQVGAGFPSKFDFDVNGMTFNGNYKAIKLYKG